MTHLPQIYLVALPIGNPLDLSHRASKVLQEADYVFCEDSRKFNMLVESCGVALKSSLRVVSIPGDEEWNYPWSDLERHQGVKVILCSDAGTPSVNDPGRALIKEALQRKWSLQAIPGPSAPILALQWTGGFGLPFLFAGFAPRGGVKEQDSFLRSLEQSRTFAFFDTRHNVISTLSSLVSLGWGDKNCFLTREMTKTHEEMWSGTLAEILQKVEKKLSEDNAIGELTLLIEGGAKDKTIKHERLAEAPEMMAQKIMSILQLPPKQASKILSELTGFSKQEAYDWMIQNKKDKIS